MPDRNTRSTWQPVGTLLGEGWRVCYTDGTGRDNRIAEAYHREDRSDNLVSTGSLFLEDAAIVANGETMRLVTALEAYRYTDTEMVVLWT